MRPDETFLSIDIDFWRVLEPNELEETLDVLILRLQRLSVSIVAVMNHQQMLPFVAASGARRLVNVDAHSDLASCAEELNCGTWISYVPWRAVGSYWWITNNLAIDGECSGATPIFHRMHNPDWVNQSEWKTIKCSENVDRMPRDIFYNAIGAGLCMSPSFCGPGHKDVFRHIVRRHQIPYRRGRTNEHYGRRLHTTKKLPADIRRRAMAGGTI